MPFDAELYLRLAGERALASRESSERMSWGPVLTAARALVAVGAIEAGAAQTVVDDYDLAADLRGPERRVAGMRMRGRTRLAAAHRAAAPPAPLPAPRVVACDRMLETAAEQIRVRSVSVGLRSVSVAVVVTERIPGQSGPGPGWQGGGPSQIRLADDRGTTVTASFTGGGSDREWRGHFRSDAPLAADTRWIEVEGDRVELGAGSSAAEVSIVSLPGDDPAMSYLWRQVAAQRQRHGPPGMLADAIDALAAAGRLDPDGQQLAGLAAVLDALAQPGGPGWPGRGWFGPGGPGPGRPGPGRPGPGGTVLPEPWRSLLAGRGRANGPVGAVAIGAATPSFGGGLSVLVLVLQSEPEGFQVEVETSAELGHLPFASVVDERAELTWWAADDRGGHYLGETSNWSSSQDGYEGTIDFWPALDPRAAVLELMPTAVTERAVITVPLPWAAGR